MEYYILGTGADRWSPLKKVHFIPVQISHPVFFFSFTKLHLKWDRKALDAQVIHSEYRSKYIIFLPAQNLCVVSYQLQVEAHTT